MDRSVLLLLNQGMITPVSDFLAILFSSEVFSLSLGLAIIGWAAFRRRWQMLVCLGIVILGLGVSDFLAYNLLKPYFHRFRPCHGLGTELVRVIDGCGGRFGFPSNHATNAAMVTTLLFLYLGNGWGAVCLLFSVLVGLSRIYLGVHYPLDVLGGFLTGMVLALSFYYCTRPVVSAIQTKIHARALR